MHINQENSKKKKKEWVDRIDGSQKVSQWIPDARWVKIPKEAKLSEIDKPFCLTY